MTPEQETLLLTVAGILLAEMRKNAEVPNPRIAALARALEPFEKVEVRKTDVTKQYVDTVEPRSMATDLPPLASRITEVDNEEP